MNMNTGNPFPLFLFSPARETPSIQTGCIENQNVQIRDIHNTKKIQWLSVQIMQQDEQNKQGYRLQAKKKPYSPSSVNQPCTQNFLKKENRFHIWWEWIKNSHPFIVFSFFLVVYVPCPFPNVKHKQTHLTTPRRGNEHMLNERMLEMDIAFKTKWKRWKSVV